VLGLLLDIEIRSHSNNRRSLDDFMRDLFDRCQARGRGFADYELASVASNLCGQDMGEWFDRYVYGTMVPPYQEILARAGIRYTEKRSRRKLLRGLRRGRGMLYYRNPDAASQQRLIDEGTVSMVAGREVHNLGDVSAAIATMQIGDQVEITLEHPLRGEFTSKLSVTSVPRVQVKLQIDPQAGKEARVIRKGIIIGNAGR